jgi:hypothetical protein
MSLDALLLATFRPRLGEIFFFERTKAQKIYFSIGGKLSSFVPASIPHQI